MSENKSTPSTLRTTTIHYVQSNTFEPNDDIQVLVVTINCKGVMGAGLAALFRDKFPDNHEDYQQRCKREEVVMGQPYLYKGSTPWVLNFPTKHHWRDKSKISDIENGLEYFVTHAKKWGIQSIAFPALGCGLGKLSWNKVYPLMCKYLRQLEGVRVEIFSKDPEPPVEKIKPISDFFKKRKPIEDSTTASKKSKIEEEPAETNTY